MSEPVIKLEGVWKIFGERADEAMQAVKNEGLTKPEVLEKFGCVVGIADCSFEVARGEIFCVMGLSGSGKSTLLRAVNGLNPIVRGSVTVADSGGETTVNDCSPERLRALRSR